VSVRARLVLAAAVLPTACRLFSAAPVPVPTAHVQSGALDLTVHARGEIRASRSSALVAPAADGALTVARAAATGSTVRAGQVVCELDSPQMTRRLAQHRLDLLQIEQELARTEADFEIQKSADEVERRAVRNGVRRAEMDVTRGELLSEADRRAHRLALEEAQRRQTQLEADIPARRDSRAAILAGLRERVRQAQAVVRETLRALEGLKLRAPHDGIVVLAENTDALGAFRLPGTAVPEFRAGDVVSAGRTLGEVLDPADMEVVARVREGEAAHLLPGMPVEIALDGAPRRRHPGRIKDVARTAGQGFWGDAGRRLEVRFSLDAASGFIHPGASVAVRIPGWSAAGSLHLPRQAVFEKDGQTIVYVREGARFQARTVRVLRETETHVALEGLPPGTEAALADPRS
jgi:multidrug resistance efflux pump